MKVLDLELHQNGLRTLFSSIEGLEVGKDSLSLSHLQLANDTIFFCSGKKESFLFVEA